MADRARAAHAELPSVPPVSLDQTFDGEALVALRSAVAAHGSSLGLTQERLELLVIVAHELASNAVRHGGGHGRLRLWRDGDRVRCRVSDDGPGFLDRRLEEWRHRPPIDAEGGRGLYFVQALADGVTVDSRGQGTTVTAWFEVQQQVPGLARCQGYLRERAELMRRLRYR
jgi:anti-sigma regulatory factor (Ser/Thr protein kinase)